jgi:hypothetical protein
LRRFTINPQVEVISLFFKENMGNYVSISIHCPLFSFFFYKGPFSPALKTSSSMESEIAGVGITISEQKDKKSVTSF